MADPSEEPLYEDLCLFALRERVTVRVCRRCGALLSRGQSPMRAHDAFHDAADALLADALRRSAAEEREYYEQAEERERSQ